MTDKEIYALIDRASKSVFYKFHSLGIERQALFSYGYEGFLKAQKRFKPGRLRKDGKGFYNLGNLAYVYVRFAILDALIKISKDKRKESFIRKHIALSGGAAPEDLKITFPANDFEKRRKIYKRIYNRERYRSNPEVRKRQAAYFRERYKDPEWRKKRRAYNRKQQSDPEFRKRQAAYKRERRKNDPEYRERLTAIERERRKSPEYKKRMAAYRRRPEARAYQAAYNRERYKAAMPAGGPAPEAPPSGG